MASYIFTFTNTSIGPTDEGMAKLTAVNGIKLFVDGGMHKSDYTLIPNLPPS